MLSRKTIQTPGFADALARLANPAPKTASGETEPKKPKGTPETPGESGCCDIPVKPATIGDDSGSKANETGGLPGDSGPLATGAR